MPYFRNSSKGARGILLTTGAFVFIDPGKTGFAKAHKIKAVGPDLEEVDPAAAIEDEDAEDAALAQAPDDLDLTEGDDDEEEVAELVEVPYPANLVLVTIGDNDVHTVHCPWLDAPEDYADPELAEARQAELREIGPPEGWEYTPPETGDPEQEVDPAAEGTFDHDDDGDAGGSAAPAPSDELTAKRREYKAALGKNAFPGWDMAELDKRIAAHAAKTA